MRSTWTKLITVMAIILTAGVLSAEVVSYEEIVRGNLKEMTKLSGTFDLYDSVEDKILNLRMIEILPDIRSEGKNTFVPVRFRDINTGDIVMVEVRVSMISEGKYDSQWSIKEVQKLKSKSETKEKYDDAEIQRAMRDYIEKKSKFTGYLMMFDQKKETMRKLELVELNPKVRRFGILSISTALFEDKETGEKVTADIHVKNKKGKLKVETLKIKSVRKK